MRKLWGLPDDERSDRGNPSTREGYWSSFTVPVGVGLGSSLVAFLMLSNLTINDDTSIVLVLLLVSVFHLGHIALWPLLAAMFFCILAESCVGICSMCF